MIFLEATARRESAAGACLAMVELGAIELCVSHEILAEVGDVLRRPKVRQRFPALTDHAVERFVAALQRLAIVFSDVPRVFRFDRDPKDEPYINLAIATGANYLVTRDKNFLDLADASSQDGSRLCHHAPDLDIVEPRTFLVDVRRKLLTGHL